MSKFPGLDTIIRTGYVGIAKNVPCPAIESTVLENADTLYTIVKKLLNEHSISLDESVRLAGTPRKESNVKFCDLEWVDGNHINGKVRDDADRVIGTFRVELFAGMGTIPKESIKQRKEKHPMRNLYQVFVVDPQEDVVHDILEISKSPDGAKFKALTDLQGELEKDIDEYDILVVPQGSVRDKKEVQEVKLVTG